MGMFDLVAEKVMSDCVKVHQMSEPWLLHLVTLGIQKNHRLVVSSSMPIRDAEMFAARSSNCTDSRSA